MHAFLRKKPIPIACVPHEQDLSHPYCETSTCSCSALRLPAPRRDNRALPRPPITTLRTLKFRCYISPFGSRNSILSMSFSIYIIIGHTQILYDKLRSIPFPNVCGLDIMNSLLCSKHESIVDILTSSCTWQLFQGFAPPTERRLHFVINF